MRTVIIGIAAQASIRADRNPFATHLRAAGVSPMKEGWLAVIVGLTLLALVLVGAIVLTAYFALKVECEEAARPTFGHFWERFPKFMLGFVAASAIGTAVSAVGVRRQSRDRDGERPPDPVLDLRVRVDRPGILGRGLAAGGVATGCGVRLGDRRQHRCGPRIGCDLVRKRPGALAMSATLRRCATPEQARVPRRCWRGGTARGRRMWVG